MNGERKKPTNFNQVSMAMKGSYFPNEDYDFENTHDKIVLFVEMLKKRGCYIGEDGHIRGKRGGNMSKITRNGYWLTGAAYNRKDYYFCEHRVVWVWYNGAIPDGMVINHKDYNRSNNHIENLELMTQKENVEYSRCNFNHPQGEKSGKAKITDKQAQAIQYLGNVCGWSMKQINSLIGGVMTDASINRVVNKKRYAHLPDAASILEVYPTIVAFTQNKDISKDGELIDYTLGLCGEAGEFTDLVKKSIFHGTDINPTDLLYELGDVLYYLVAICNVLGIDFYEVAMNNNAKLLARYPNGFSCEDSNNRIEEHNDGTTKEERL